LNKKRLECIIIGVISLIIITVTFYIGQLLWGIIAIAIVFWLLMLIDCLQRRTENFPRTGEYEKLIWLLALIFLNFIGAVFYCYLVWMHDNRGKYTKI